MDVAPPPGFNITRITLESPWSQLRLYCGTQVELSWAPPNSWMREPSDHLCVVGELTRDPGTGTQWECSGELIRVVPANR